MWLLFGVGFCAPLLIAYLMIRPHLNDIPNYPKASVESNVVRFIGGDDSRDRGHRELVIPRNLLGPKEHSDAFDFYISSLQAKGWIIDESRYLGEIDGSSIKAHKGDKFKVSIFMKYRRNLAGGHTYGSKDSRLGNSKSEVMSINIYLEYDHLFWRVKW